MSGQFEAFLVFVFTGDCISDGFSLWGIKAIAQSVESLDFLFVDCGHSREFSCNGFGVDCAGVNKVFGFSNHLVEILHVCLHLLAEFVVILLQLGKGLNGSVSNDLEVLNVLGEGSGSLLDVLWSECVSLSHSCNLVSNSAELFEVHEGILGSFLEIDTDGSDSLLGIHKNMSVVLHLSDHL